VLAMNKGRKVEIFSAGCPVCEEAAEKVNKIVCEYCEVNVLDMNNPEVKVRADELEIHSVPAIVIDGKVSDCCAGRRIDENALKSQILG